MVLKDGIILVAKVYFLCSGSGIENMSGQPNDSSATKAHDGHGFQVCAIQHARICPANGNRVKWERAWKVFPSDVTASKHR